MTCLDGIHCVKTGIEALEYLRREGGFERLGDPLLPSLILLDLNMPQMNGLELLAERKADPQLRTIPVVVLTTSNDELELERCYGLGAACCIVKPIDFSCFVEAVRRVGLYWTLCETPRPRRRTAQNVQYRVGVDVSSRSSAGIAARPGGFPRSRSVGV